ncbi:MAG: bifunctional 2-polyprenyl-6-hydroxyphenol methylase/3-demethylubiquinol 3-O-methyltransferase UbiG [Pseudomonadota bacterium]|nr:bifunctional 2-polyprenyl-6-hydroxyphenol methylase/3-demethylubiquinol 3-O-methyltransferase UbiG [Pseudomonadota bacterium]
MKSKKITKTLNQEENIFDKLSDEWWKTDGSFNALHSFNFVRIKFIRETLEKDGIKNLKNLKILDIGCGGGILTEPLARLGAKVYGVDENENAIKVAINHAKRNKLKIQYKKISFENINFTEKFDVILCMEVLEHIDSVDALITTVRKLLKPKGNFIGSTINKTMISYLLAILFAENILNIVPKETHDWKKFIKPKILKKTLVINDFKEINFQGVLYNPVTNNWKKIRNQSVNFMFSSKLK